MSPTSTVLSGQLLDLGVLRLERATKRLQVDDFEGALADLKLALSHMQRAAADPLSVQHLSAIINDMERAAG
jgi:hypothetical protein